jgi:hypothetical protein
MGLPSIIPLEGCPPTGWRFFGMDLPWKAEKSGYQELNLKPLHKKARVERVTSFQY